VVGDGAPASTAGGHRGCTGASRLTTGDYKGDLIRAGMPWERDRFAQQVKEILDSVEAPLVDSQVRLTLQKHLYRAEIFGTDGRGHITLLIRTILESENNADALVEPIVSAVSSCMRPAWTDLGLRWIEAFDKIPLTAILQQMRGLNLFSENSIAHYYSVALQNKLAAILEPTARPATKPQRERKPPRVLTRIAGVAANVALGRQLVALRAQVKSNRAFSHAVRARFDIDTQHAVECAAAARAYGSRPEIFGKLSWNALVALSSPTMPAPVRLDLEVHILAGERIGAPQIRAARLAHAAERNQAVRRMAA
jgi:hypothetical protein